MWHYVANHSVGCVCVRRSENLFVCFGAKPTQRPELEISHETGSGGGNECPREDRGSVDKVRWREAVDNGEQRRPVDKGRRRDAVDNGVQGKDGQQKEAVRENSQKWVGTPSVFLKKFRAKYTSAIVYRFTENARCHKNPFLRLELTQVRVCSFSPTLSVVFLGAVKKCDIRRRKPQDESLATRSLV